MDALQNKKFRDTIFESKYRFIGLRPFGSGLEIQEARHLINSHTLLNGRQRILTPLAVGSKALFTVVVQAIWVGAVAVEFSRLFLHAALVARLHPGGQDSKLRTTDSGIGHAHYGGYNCDT